MKSYQQFFAELKRRKVFRVMAVYGVVCFGVIEAAATSESSHPRRYRQGLAHEALGETERAAELYADFIRRWADADPELQVLVNDARQRLEALDR